VLGSEEGDESEGERGNDTRSGVGSGGGSGIGNTTWWKEYAQGDDIVFHEYGVVEADSVEEFSTRDEFSYLSLPDMLVLLNVKSVAFLRIDCEGCEYNLVRDMERLYTKADGALWPGVSPFPLPHSSPHSNPHPHSHPPAHLLAFTPMPLSHTLPCCISPPQTTSAL